MTTWTDVTATLLARWPAQRWDREQAAAYIRELQSDGLQPESAMTGIRAATGAFVPSVGEVTVMARRVADAGRPTWDECYAILWGPRGILHSPRLAEKITAVHPLIAAFVNAKGVQHLRGLLVEDPDDGNWRRKDLREAWDRHVEASDGREIAALAASTSRSDLTHLNPLAALNMPRPALAATTTHPED